MVNGFLDLHWPEIIVAGILGYLIPYIIPFFKFLISLFKKDYLTGTWYTNFATNPDNGDRDDFRLISVKWKIRKNFLNQYVVTETRGENKDYTYTGSLSKTKNFILIKLKNYNSQEHVFVKLYDPVPFDDDNHIVAYGLELSLDFTNSPVARPIISSKEIKLKTDMIKKYFNKYYNYYPEFQVTRAR